MTVLEFPDEAGLSLSACLGLYRRLAAGVSVVTALGDDGPTAMTASSVTSVSLRPPLLLVSLAERSHTLAAIRSRRSFGVFLLREDQRGLAERFAHADRDAWEGTGRRVFGVPTLPDALAWSVCLLQDVHHHGDHILAIGRVVAAHASSGRPLLWHDRAFASLAG
jgi:flavin reductase (DIM6/NTAB) family NADH-FMN oxidoreductase RutF